MKDRTKRLQKLDKKYVWHPFTQMQDWVEKEPLVVDSAQGVYLRDAKGVRYIDGVSSLWVNVHGHRKKALDLAIQKQLKKIAHSTLLGLANVPSIELAQALVQIAPRGLTKVFYSDNGSTAIEVAIKMAYQYWRHVEPDSRRDKFITFSDAYHGDTLGAVSIGGVKLFHEAFGPLLFNVVRFPSPYLFSKNGQSEKLIEMMEERLHGHEQEFIGVVMEPLIQGAAGMLTHSKGFLKKVRSFCDRHHLLMIVDEVATGFGRSGKMFACDHEKVTPDLMAIAKGITGGYLPLAATLVKEKIYNAFLGQYSEFKTFFHGHTYTGNPLACAVALASLRLFKKERIFQSLSPKIRWFKRELNKFLNLRHVAEIRQCGMMVGIELVKTRSPRKEYALVEKIGIRVCQKVREYGVILRSLGNVIVIMPPLSIHQKELRVILNATYRAIEEVTGKGFRD